MNARRKACILSLLAPLLAAAQGVGSLRTGPAEAGFRGEAELYGGMERGDFRPGYAASSLWRAGGGAGGTLHGARTSWKGSFGFEHAEGKEMTTSMFRYPGYYPVDVLEFTPGDKTFQTYRLSGGFATEADGGTWIIGAEAAYEAANAAKRKDIRYTDYAMDLRVEPSVTRRWGPDGGIGAGYVFRKTSESIDAEQVGSATSESYYAFFDKGMRYGTYQVWDGAGVHLDEAGVGLLPVKEFAHGFAFHLQKGASSGEFEYVWTRGTVGEKGYTWFRFPGQAFSLRGGGSHEARAFRGAWEIALSSRSQRLDEQVIDKVTEGGVTTPVIYGGNSVSSRRHTELSAAYTLHFRSGPWTQVRAEAGCRAWKERSFLMYPYTDRLSLDAFWLAAEGSLQQGRFEIRLRGLLGWGGKAEQGLSGGTEETLSRPYRLQDDWNRKMEYLTATRTAVQGAVKYALGRGFFVQIEGSWEHGFGLQYLPGAQRFVSALWWTYHY